MEVAIAVPLIILPFFLPLLAGLMAISFGRKFWPWFFIGMILPLVANIILLCLPEKSIPQNPEPVPVENDELFNDLFEKKTDKHRIVRNVLHAARA